MSSEQPVKSVEGWVIILRGLSEEAVEDDVRDLCCEAGAVRNIYLGIDGATGYARGYALVEYGKEEDATEAVRSLDGKKHMGKVLSADWAFVEGEVSAYSQAIRLRKDKEREERMEERRRERERERKRERDERRR